MVGQGFGVMVRLSVLYAGLFASIGIYAAYMPAWFEAQGLGADAIAFLIAVPMILRVGAGPLIGFYADRSGRRRRTLIVTSAATALCFAALPLGEGFGYLAAVAAAYGVAFAAVMPLTDAVALSRARSFGLSYGRMRLWGSAAFIAANVAGGAVLDAYGADAIVWALIGAGGLMAGAALLVPVEGGAGLATPDRKPIARRDVGDLLGSAPFVAMLLASSAIHASHAVFYLFGTIHWQSLGFSGTAIGALWATGVVAEMIVFWYARPLVAGVTAARLFALAAIVGIIRWPLMAMDLDIGWQFLIQLSHAATFGAAHLAAMHELAERVPDRLANTAQSVYATINTGLVMAGASLLAGQLYAGLGGGAYAAMAGLAAVGLAAALWLARYPHKAGDGG